MTGLAALSLVWLTEGSLVTDDQIREEKKNLPLARYYKSGLPGCQGKRRGADLRMELVLILIRGITYTARTCNKL
ncbi:hypothetical protein GGI42DRAFT_331339 [Trichoderma sp. SZMC 28013]